jgi:hypothetical protein
MQIDFHHAVTYVIARIAGFSHQNADIVAYSAQYVDDATNSGTIRFDNGAMYSRISSAHKMLDYRNSKTLKNHRVWIPFHFLPGNGGLAAGKNPRGKFIRKIKCSPNSPAAQDMVAACIRSRDKAYGLHRLGVTMHVYADTWAHQGFAGVNHKINRATRIRAKGEDDASFRDRAANYLVGRAMPLGHGSVLSYPDRPYLEWSYRSPYLGRDVVRDNPKDFLEAAEHMCMAMQRFQLGDPDADVAGFAEHAGDKAMLAELMRSIVNEDGDKRHAQWVQAIGDGKFSFGKQAVFYIPKGSGSWKHKAIGTLDSVDDADEEFKWNDTFLKSNWKHFHDALQAHRFEVLHDVLPRYGIQAA